MTFKSIALQELDKALRSLEEDFISHVIDEQTYNDLLQELPTNAAHIAHARLLRVRETGGGHDDA
jgi:hypothetical protein